MITDFVCSFGGSGFEGGVGFPADIILKSIGDLLVPWSLGGLSPLTADAKDLAGEAEELLFSFLSSFSG